MERFGDRRVLVESDTSRVRPDSGEVHCRSKSSKGMGSLLRSETANRTSRAMEGSSQKAHGDAPEKPTNRARRKPKREMCLDHLQRNLVLWVLRTRDHAYAVGQIQGNGLHQRRHREAQMQVMHIQEHSNYRGLLTERNR